MVIAEETGQPGEVRVRFTTLQRELLLDELELARDGTQDGIRIAMAKARPNPAYIAQKEEELDDVQRLITLITGTVDPGANFELVGPAYLLCSCIRSATGYVTERLMNRVHELRPGLDSTHALHEVRAAQELASVWLATLMETNRFETDREAIPSELPAAPTAE
jgi:hypothetical protein